MRRGTGKMGVCSKTWPSGKKGHLINLSHYVLRKHVFRHNLSLTVQGKQQRCRARNRGGESRATLHAGRCFAKHCSRVEKWMGRMKHLSFVIPKLTVQSFGLPDFHNSLWTCSHSTLLFGWLLDCTSSLWSRYLSNFLLRPSKAYSVKVTAFSHLIPSTDAGFSSCTGF